MTADVTKTPFSVDYTGRDYYAIREQLIARVKDRVPDWTGNNSSDFGLALVESFAYMGDLLNYYIDRVANESYILTATQRDTLLNLSKMYGYSPANYTSAVVDIDFTNNNGYKKHTGAEIIEDGIITGSTVVHSIAKVIVPNDHPFTVDGEYSTVIVEGLSTKVTGTVGGVEIDYAASVYNGTFKVIKTGYENIGLNVIWYRPAATISNITVSGTEATVSYAGSLVAEVGQKIRISGVTVPSGNNFNGVWYVKGVTLPVDTTPGSFVFDSAANPAQITKVTSNGTTITYSTFGSTPIELYGYTTPTWHNFIAGQNVSITGVISSSNTGGTANTGYNFTTATVAAATDIVAGVTNVLVAGTDVTFTTSKQFTTGQIVSLRNIKSLPDNPEGTAGSHYNVSNAVITGTSTSTATITNVVGSTGGNGVVTFTTSSNHGFLKDQFVTITNVVSTSPDDGTDTDVYNISSAQIKSVPTSTSFTIQAYWTDTFKTGGTATLYKFTISQSGLTGESVTSTGIIGGAFCKQFTVTSNRAGGTWTSGGSAVALIGGTPTLTNAEVTYAELPAIVDTGGFVKNVGTTTVPAGSQITTQVSSAEGVQNIVFSTLNDVTVPFGGVSVAMVKEGEQVSTRSENAANTTVLGYDIAGEVLGFASSNSDANQSFLLKENIVDSSSIRVFVDRGTAFEEWTRVPHIMDYGPSDTVFEVSFSETNKPSIVFGDGISGEIPPPEATIKAQYIAGGGLIGNVEAETLTTWGKIVNSDDEDAVRNISVINNLAATGGGDPESNDSIRYNAPRALRALNRAVTLQDFEDLSLSVERVAKAKAVAVNRGSVTVYIAPYDDGTSERPGYYGTELNTTWDYIKSGVEDQLSDKLQIGTSVTVSPPVYTYVHADIAFTPLPQYSAAVVKTNIKKMMVTEFGYENMQFNDVITPEEVEFSLRQVEGVQNAKVISLYRLEGEGRNTLIGEVNELFIFSEGELGLIPASTDATLAAFTINPSSGSSTWTPVFKSNLLSYRVTIPAAATSINVGTQANDTNDTDSSGVASVTVNGKSVGAASHTSTIATSDTTVGARTELVITVTAADGFTVNTYKATVVKV
jgi:hypothetical protein